MFRQGDVELALGWNPIPLFNRANFPELASMQVPLPSSLVQLVLVHMVPLPWSSVCLGFLVHLLHLVALPWSAMHPCDATHAAAV